MKTTIRQIVILIMISVLFASCKQQKSDSNSKTKIQQADNYGENESESMQMYSKLMSSFNPDWENQDPAPEDYPEYFGGAFIDHDGKLVVCIVGNAESQKNIVENIVGSDDFITESCTYSYREMMQVMDKIDEFLSNENIDHNHPFILNFAGAVADVFENRVVVRLLEVNDTITTSFKKDVSNSNAVKFETGEMPDLM